MSNPEDETELEIVVTTIKPLPISKTKRQPRYAVVVLDDDFHTHEYVTLAMSRIFGYSEQRGDQIAAEIDVTGRAIVWTGALEIAELKRDQIREFGPDGFGTKVVTFPLGVELEPVD